MIEELRIPEVGLVGLGKIGLGLIEATHAKVHISHGVLDERLGNDLQSLLGIPQSPGKIDIPIGQGESHIVKNDRIIRGIL